MCHIKDTGRHYSTWKWTGSPTLVRYETPSSEISAPTLGSLPLFFSYGHRKHGTEKKTSQIAKPTSVEHTKKISMRTVTAQFILDSVFGSVRREDIPEHMHSPADHGPCPHRQRAGLQRTPPYSDTPAGTGAVRSNRTHHIRGHHLHCSTAKRCLPAY